MQAKYTVTPEMAHLSFFNKIVRQFGADLSIPTTYNILLILEEAYSNIVKYGELQKDDLITVRFKRTSKHFTLEFVDNGKAFNPLKEPLPDPQKTHERTRGGGFGIFLFKNMTDKATYKREGGKNKLLLRIPLNNE